MASGQSSSNVPLLPNAAMALAQFKQEVASELGIQNYQGYLGDLPSRINGAVGGHMVRRMIAAAEQSLIDQTSSQVSSQFRSSLGSSSTTQSQSGTSNIGAQSFGTSQSFSTNWNSPSHV